MSIKWKNGKKFAFTFCDDTDFAVLENVKPVYDFLDDLGMRTTKLVWLSKGNETERNSGDTCEDKEYLDWLISIQQRGFEIALHNVSASSSSREKIEEGLERFKSLFGSVPKIHCNHTGCLDNLYWGSFRVNGWRRSLYDIWTRGKNKNISLGHVNDNKYFWGDLCREQIQYVRNFTCDELNTLKFCPQMPYHETRKPFVNFWFAATNASSPKYFKQNFSISAIDKLVGEGGLCIAYVHFGTRFYNNGKIDEHFSSLMKYVAAKDGWFAPVSEVLDFLRKDEDCGERNISSIDLQKLELRWLYNKWGKKLGI